MTFTHTRGRGTNPVSRANLTGPNRGHCVKALQNGAWVVIKSGLTYSQAYTRALKFEETNPNKVQPQFAACLE